MLVYAEATTRYEVETKLILSGCRVINLVSPLGERARVGSKLDQPLVILEKGIHGCTLEQTVVMVVTGFDRNRTFLDNRQYKTPEPIVTKFCTGDYIGIVDIYLRLIVYFACVTVPYSCRIVTINEEYLLFSTSN